MTKIEKLLNKVQRGEGLFNMRLPEVESLVIALGGTRQGGNGSHNVYSFPGIPESINLQEYPGDGAAKAYQIRQLRSLIKKYGLTLA